MAGLLLPKGLLLPCRHRTLPWPARASLTNPCSAQACSRFLLSPWQNIPSQVLIRLLLPPLPASSAWLWALPVPFLQSSDTPLTNVPTPWWHQASLIMKRDLGTLPDATSWGAFSSLPWVKRVCILRLGCAATPCSSLLFWIFWTFVLLKGPFLTLCLLAAPFLTVLPERGQDLDSDPLTNPWWPCCCCCAAVVRGWRLACLLGKGPQVPPLGLTLGIKLWEAFHTSPGERVPAFSSRTWLAWRWGFRNQVGQRLRSAPRATSKSPQGDVQVSCPSLSYSNLPLVPLSIKATFPRLRSCLFMASKEKSARMFPCMAFRLLFLEFHVKPLKQSEDSEGLTGNGPSSFAQGTLLKVEHGGVMIKASISPASISCNHLRCTSGCEHSAFRLCWRSTSITSST